MEKTKRREKLTIANPSPFLCHRVESVHCPPGHDIKLTLHKKCTVVIIFFACIAKWRQFGAGNACTLLLIKGVNSVCLHTEQVNDLPRVSRFSWIVIFLWQLPSSQSIFHVLAAFPFAFHEFGKYPCLKEFCGDLTEADGFQNCVQLFVPKGWYGDRPDQFIISSRYCHQLRSIWLFRCPLSKKKIHLRKKEARFQSP